MIDPHLTQSDLYPQKWTPPRCPLFTYLIYTTHMSIRIITQEQQERLRSNLSVESCTTKTITYTKDFKLYALKQYRTKQCTTKEIFTNAGFDLHIIGYDTPKDCLKRWRKTYQEYNIHAFTQEQRGRPRIQKVKEISKEEQLRRLTLENAYLKEENQLLTHLRAKRAESNSRLHKNMTSLNE